MLLRPKPPTTKAKALDDGRDYGRCERLHRAGTCLSGYREAKRDVCAIVCKRQASPGEGGRGLSICCFDGAENTKHRRRTPNIVRSKEVAMSVPVGADGYNGMLRETSQELGCWRRGRRRWMTMHNEQPTANNQQTANSKQQTANCKQQTANSNQQPTTNNQPTTHNTQQPTTNNQQPTNNTQRKTNNNQQPTTNSQKPTSNKQHTTHNVQRTTHNTQHTTQDTQRITQ